MKVSISESLVAFLICAICAGSGLLIPSPASSQTHSGPAAFKSPADGGPRRWTVTVPALDVYETPAKSALPSDTLGRGEVLSNLGCHSADALMWCEVRPFRGGAKGFVLADGLAPAIGPDGSVPLGKNNSKRRARKQDFDAIGKVPCAQEQGQSLGVCTASVARAGGGDATLVVAFANGFKRQLYFVQGEFLRASATMSGVGTDMDWRFAGGIHLIRVDDQRFEIPDDLLFAD